MSVTFRGSFSLVLHLPAPKTVLVVTLGCVKSNEVAFFVLSLTPYASVNTPPTLGTPSFFIMLADGLTVKMGPSAIS